MIINVCSSCYRWDQEIDPDRVKYFMERMEELRENVVSSWTSIFQRFNNKKSVASINFNHRLNVEELGGILRIIID